MPQSENYERAINHIEDCHPAATVMAAVSKQIQDPNIKVDDVVKLLSTDISLSSDVIRLSNSAYYGFEVECQNLETAINRIGFREVIRLIGLSVSKNLFNRDLHHYDIPAEAFWEDSITSAILMEGFAIYVNKDPQDAYLIGLMYSVGMIIINQIMNDFQIPHKWDRNMSQEEWEKELLGFNFGFAGATILKRWNFPNSVCSPILHATKTPSLKNPRFSHTCLYLCRRIVDECGYGFKKTQLNNLDELVPYLESIKINPSDIHNLLEAAQESFYEIGRRIKTL